MSRILVFGLDGKQQGELRGIATRGWTINDGGQAEIALPTHHGHRG